jgi:hypothetical protein
MPRWLRTERQQRAGQAAEEVGFGIGCGERKANAAGGFDYTGVDFQEAKTQRHGLGSGQLAGLGNGLAHSKHQPISGGVENETTGLASAERQLVRSEASCVLCSLIRFSAWPRALC